MAEARAQLPEPCSAQGASIAGARYASQLGQGQALLLRHSGTRDGRWWLVACHQLATVHELYSTALASLPRGSSAALAVWFDGGNIRFGELFDPQRQPRSHP